ncbi:MULTISPECIES: hypothetical protein [Mycobacterium]|uniref:ESX-1 secretion-associated protein EspA/EspE-like domain-containing protein n=1 Tax=Mycobacterium colombiense TaxID=339268 RepID=A0A329M2G4_9MYCO|nr:MULTISPECIES: hypothetical protein [Mycobacterium]MDM4138797.1 hypothetical protein [Mycobacterium sp. FLAC0960]RAV14084.1 hypothetical protein DQP57_06880 [Mycobacterium colombiense]
MQLKHLTIGELVAGAGGDPWEVNRTLQAGQPGQISNLAKAFFGAGRHTAEADHAFAQAQQRFNGAWNHQDGGPNPINASAEVQRTVKSLGAQSEQLPKIGADLENIAAALADAQKAGTQEIVQLEGQLEQLDHLIDLAEQDLRDHPDAESQKELHSIINALRRAAVNDTKDALGKLHDIRDSYSSSLRHAQKNLADDGYDPTSTFGADAHEPETPDQARQDVTDALGGDKGAAARVNGVLHSITPDQLAGKVPLTAEQASVLSQLQAQEHGMSIDALNTAEQRLGDEKGMIGNSWQLMSNPNLTFPKTPLTVGAKQGTDTIKGGAAQLPESVQKALNSSGLEYMRQTNDIANIVKDGDKSFQTNTDLDRAMIHKAGAMMDTPYWQHDPASQGQNIERDPAMDPTVSNVLSAMSPDHQVVHDTMTGGDHDKFLQNLTHHAWKDNGQAVGSLFSWTGDSAQGPEAKIAGETARAYSDYVGHHSQDLLHLPGNHTLGQVNPNLVQAMGHGLDPYINNVAGTSGGLPDFGKPLDEKGDIHSGSLPVAKGVFSVIDSDPTAARDFNKNAYTQALLHDSSFALNPHHDGYSDQLYDAATLRGLVDVGTHNAFQANEQNGYHQQLSEYDSKKLAYEDGVQAASTVGGWVPGVGKVTGPAIGIIGHNLENDILGPAPTAPGQTPIQPMDIGSADQEMLDAMLGANQHISGLPPEYVVYDGDHPYGRLATFDEMQAKHPDLTAGQYNNVIGPALSQTLDLPPNEKMSPDQYMVDRYNNVIGVPEPPGKK